MDVDVATAAIENYLDSHGLLGLFEHQNCYGDIHLEDVQSLRASRHFCKEVHSSPGCYRNTWVVCQPTQVVTQLRTYAAVARAAEH